jgi:cytochrome c-type biogenesis protein CcmH
MTLWFVLALMTMAAVFAVLWPLARASLRPSGSDTAVYRDQLNEIERDRSAGLIGAPEAEAARVEIARRLIAAADMPVTPPDPSLRRRRVVAIMALVFLPLGALATYLTLGSPQLPGAARSALTDLPPERQSIESMVAQIEKHLEKSPQDGRGWEVLAPVYLRAGRFDEAVKARQNALRLLGATPAREADLGEALIAAANGIVTVEAKAALDRAALDPAQDKAQFFLGLAADQDGKPAEAAAIWRRLLAAAKPDTPWRPLVEQSLARVDPKAASPGPTPDDIAAAQSLTPEQRSAMIAGMVERLAARLKEDGSDFDGWLKLARAYVVLGETEKARAVIADARGAFRSDDDKQRRIDDFVRHLESMTNP